MNVPNKIITHHAVSAIHHTAQDVDVWHIARWPGFTSKVFRNNKGFFYTVGYHYVIEWDGTTVQCRAHNEEGAHCVGQNTQSIGVCFMGNFDNHYPSIEQKKAWQELYKKIRNEFAIITPDRIYPHRLYANKSCHGKLLGNDYFTLVLGEIKQPSIAELMETVRQLQNRLAALIKNKRMK